MSCGAKVEYSMHLPSGDQPVFEWRREMKIVRKIKMILKVVPVFFLGLVFVALTEAGASGNESSADESSKWDTAGKELSEAAKAVGEASKETWQDVKESGSETWEKTKKAANEDWQEAKQKGAEVWSQTKEETKEGIESTKEESLTFWQKVKKKTRAWYNKIRGRVHEATAPEPDPGN